MNQNQINPEKEPLLSSSPSDETPTSLCCEEKPLPKSKRNISIKHLLFYLAVILLSCIYLFVGYHLSVDKAGLFRNEMQVTSSVARVTEILHDRNDMGEIGGHVYYEHVITFQADILSGDGKGQSVKALQKIDNLTGNGMRPVSVGDKIFLFQTNPEENIEWEAGDFYRSDSILILAAVFLLGLLVFGRSKGLKTILSLVFTCLFTIAMTLALVSGPSRKSLSAALGCAGGVMVAGILSFFMDHVMKLTGYLNDEAMYVSLLNESSPIDLRAIIFAAIIIGAMGATMDVAMDITSSLFEIHRKIPDISFWHLVQSGFNIGRDIMGTMANTLILAYIGSSLTTVLLYASYQASLEQLLNRELIIVELLQALSGSIGILCTIPISAFIASGLCCMKKRAVKKEA
ncbi:YibE/F family protein [Negativibacillus massiliensis]|uniref:YibE/F family protein n=1 Tax=Negativibacillus massiliensis TaxID=1871035 RepID=UPI002A83BE8C|nr:YibE/F family protein [Negativibacillus massiliensis]MDY4047103.1 YibE/F family protein [Negativibacillus massiliensis]